MDALLGAAAIGDIGRHFPDTDEKYRGISSMELLRHVGSLLSHKGFSVNNIDATIVAQRPKLAPYVDIMAANISGVLGIDTGRVNIKATTEEGLGFTGSGEAISAMAAASLAEI
jgi:2-C-methyl-D-erythritol 2,4-cyclodiphosphate synthase